MKTYIELKEAVPGIEKATYHARADKLMFASWIPPKKPGQPPKSKIYGILDSKRNLLYKFGNEADMKKVIKAIGATTL